MTLRLAIIVSHPIQHFAPWHREVAKLPDIELRVFFCCDWGLTSYVDPEFNVPVEWDIPLVEGYDHEFLPLARRPERLNFWQVDNPTVCDALERFDPHVLKVFGYAHRTNWRASGWTRHRRRPLMLYSDSNVRARARGWRRLVKRAVVGRFYGRVDGALFVGNNNLDYHKLYGLPEERLFPGALPVDLRQLHRSVGENPAVRDVVRERHGIPRDAFVVMLSGKYVERKRPLDLVMAVRQAAAEGTPAWALLVGEGPERVKLEEYCQRHGVANVTLTGFINQSAIPEYYATSDLIAVTSEYDPHPLVVTEGASFGLPAVVSDKIGCIGPDDTARPDVNALVYPCSDWERLGDAIKTLYRDRRLHARMADAALQVAESQDVTVAAHDLASAAHKLQELGPRYQ
jgi:glycosyltransferase involved in cell wall biosynthesis